MPLVDHELEDGIIDAVCRAQAAGTPIELTDGGPFYDRRLKKALGLGRVHKSRVCASVKRLLAGGLLQKEDTGEKAEIYFGERPKQYPIARILPA